MSDQSSEDVTPPPQSTARGGFDWLRETHQQSEPMAPLADDVPARALPSLLFDHPDPQAPPAAAPLLLPPPPVAAAPPPSLLSQAPPPAAPVASAGGFPLTFTDVPPVVPEPPASAPQSPPTSSGRPPFGAESFTPTSFAGGTGSGFALERHRSPSRSRSGNGPLDWIAFILAFLAPPVGLLLGIGAVVVDSRSKGYAAAVAKAAIGIGAALSLVLGVAFVVHTKLSNDQAAHDSIVASSLAYCAKIRADPGVLTSDTFGWPAPGDTIPDSITSIESYVTTWKSIVKVAPAGVLVDTQKVESTAASIASSVQSTQTLDDASNVAQMQNVVAATGIKTWVSDYCK